METKDSKKKEDAKFEMATLFYGGLLTIVAFIIAWLFCSCSNNEIEEVSTTPIFKIISFSKEEVNGTYQCKATIAVTDIPEKYSIDGLIYADEITKIGHNIQYSEKLKYDIHEKGEGEMYFNLFGEHKGNLILELEWKSKENLRNYLIGWHLCYGFGENCKVLMVDLDTQIINN